MQFSLARSLALFLSRARRIVSTNVSLCVWSCLRCDAMQWDAIANAKEIAVNLRAKALQLKGIRKCMGFSLFWNVSLLRIMHKVSSFRNWLIRFIKIYRFVSFRFDLQMEPLIDVHTWLLDQKPLPDLQRARFTTANEHLFHKCNARFIFFALLSFALFLLSRIR